MSGDLGEMKVRFGADTSGLESGINRAKGSIGGFASFGGGILGAVAGGLLEVGKAAIGIGEYSVKAAGDFQESMDKVQAYVGLTKKQTEDMGNSILALAPQLGVAPKALADGLYFVGSAGFRGAAALNVLKYAGMTAAAANVDAAVTSKALAVSLNALGLGGDQAGSMMDILNATVKNGVMTWPEYGNVVGKLGGAFVGTGESASMMKRNFIEANAGLDLITNSGMAGTRLGATNLNAAINILENKTDTVAKHAKAMGVNFDETKFKTMDLAHQMLYLGDLTHNNSGEMIKLMGGNSQAAKTIDFLNANYKTYGATIDSINSAMKNGATTQDMFNIAQEGFNFQITRIKSAIDAVAIGIGLRLLPMLSAVLGFVSPLISGFASWISSADGLSSIFGKISGSMEPVNAMFQDLQHWISGFNFGPLLSSVSNLGAAFSGLLTGPFAALKSNAGFNFFGNLGGAIKDFISGGIGLLQNAFNGIANFIKTNVTPAITGFVHAFLSVDWGTIGANIMGVFGTIGSTLQTIGGVISSVDWGGIFTKLWGVLQQIGGFLVANFAPVWKQLATTFQSSLLPSLLQLWGALKPLLPIFGELLGLGLIEFVVMLAGMIKGLAGLLSGFIIILSGWIQMLTGWVQIISGVFTFLYDVFTGNFGRIPADLGMIWQGIINVVAGGFKAVAGVFQTAWFTLTGIFTGMWDALLGIIQAFSDKVVGHSIIPDMVNAIVSWFQNMGPRAMSAVGSMCSQIGAAFSGLAGQAVSWGANLINGLITGIQNGMGGIASVMGNVVSTIGSFLPHSPAKQGELSHLNEYGPNFMKGFSEGIVKSKPMLTSALNMTVSPFAHLTTQSIQASAGGSASPAGGFSGPQEIYIMLDSKQIGHATAPHIVQKMRVLTGSRS